MCKVSRWTYYAEKYRQSLLEEPTEKPAHRLDFQVAVPEWARIALTTNTSPTPTRTRTELV